MQPPAPDAYGGSGYGAPSPALPEYGAEEVGRGRSKSRDPTAYIGGSQRGLDQRYDEEMGRDNPFGDAAERSNLRGLSPRPVDTSGKHGKKDRGGASLDDSPTSRKSMFHENV